jgi:hypothetical protein
LNGEGGGILIVWSLVGGADIVGSSLESLISLGSLESLGSLGSLESLGSLSSLDSLDSLGVSHWLQLLDLDVAGDSFSTGAEVDVNEALDADDVTETGRLASKTNRELVPVDMGLVRTGDMFFRNSR